MMKLRCYGGPLDGQSATVKYPGKGLIAENPDGGFVRYERERYRPASGDWQVNVFCFGSAEDFTERVLDDVDRREHDPTAFEWRNLSGGYEPHPAHG